MHRVLALGLMLLAGPAVAEGKHEHKGLFLRLTGGVAVMSMEADDADLTIDGAMGTIGVQFGGAVVENLALFADLLLLGSEETDADGRVAVGEEVRETAVVGLGPGITYYFMPVNLYVGGSVLLSGATVRTEEIDGDERERESEAGLGLSLMVGKEWWASENWAVGVAGRIFGAQFNDRNIVRDGSRWRVGSVSVLFSATYN